MQRVQGDDEEEQYAREDGQSHRDALPVPDDGLGVRKWRLSGPPELCGAFPEFRHVLPRAVHIVADLGPGGVAVLPMVLLVLVPDVHRRLLTEGLQDAVQLLRGAALRVEVVRAGPQNNGPLVRLTHRTVHALFQVLVEVLLAAGTRRTRGYRQEEYHET